MANKHKLQHCVYTAVLSCAPQQALPANSDCLMQNRVDHTTPTSEKVEFVLWTQGLV